MKVHDLMEDWPLLGFEEQAAKDGAKALFICSEEMYKRTHQFFHINGMTFITMNKFKSTLNDLDRKRLDKFGVRPAVIEATCEHPPFYTWRYDSYCSSAYNSSKDALEDYVKRNPELSLDMNTEYYMVETKFYHLFDTTRPSEKRTDFDERRFSHPHIDPFHYNFR